MSAEHAGRAGVDRRMLGPILARYTSEYPRVSIRVVEAYSATLLSLIEAGEVDLAFVTCNPDHPDIRFRLLHEDVSFWSREPLALPLNKPARLDEPPFLKLIVPPRRHAFDRILTDCLANKRIIPQRLIELDGIIGALQFVSTSSWAAILPVVTAMSCPCDTMGLLINSIAGTPITVQYFLASATASNLSTASRAFVSLAQAELVAMRRDYEAKLRPHATILPPPARTRKPAAPRNLERYGQP